MLMSYHDKLRVSFSFIPPIFLHIKKLSLKGIFFKFAKNLNLALSNSGFSTFSSHNWFVNHCNKNI